MSENDSDTCTGHMHMAMQFVHFNDRPFGKVIFSEDENEAFVVMNALSTQAHVEAVIGCEIEVWLN